MTCRSCRWWVPKNRLNSYKEPDEGVAVVFGCDKTTLHFAIKFFLFVSLNFFSGNGAVLSNSMASTGVPANVIQTIHSFTCKSFLDHPVEHLQQGIIISA